MRVLPATLPLLLLLAVQLAAPAGAVECQRKSWLAMVTDLCICEPCDQCHYDLATLECVASVDKDDDKTKTATLVANASFVPRQPSLAPGDWLLGEDEITASRNGVAREGLATWTDGNDVTLFTASDGYFAAVHDALGAAAAGAEIYFTGWEFNDVPLLPVAAQWEATRLSPELWRAMDRGANVSGLAWSNLFSRTKSVAFAQAVNKHTRATWVFDNRLPGLTATHHQKSLTVVYGDDPDARPPLAFVGGLDLTTDRWDTHFHNESRLRKDRQIKHTYDGWIDASVGLRGPSVLDVGANFVHRWNDPRPPMREDQTLLEFNNSAVERLTALRPFPRPSGNTNTTPVGNVTVQLTRTYSCKEPYPFAPKGERSIFNSRLKAIARAQNYIYVEDQYFIQVPALQEALRRRLPELAALIIITQKPELSATVAGYEKLQYQTIHALQREFPDKVFVFAPRDDLNLYVHTKVVLIDDVYLSIGSANWNRRSMTSDSELAVNLIDRETQTIAADGGIEVARLARAFRLAKFSEFSGQRVEELAKLSLVDAINALQNAATKASGGGIIAPLQVQQESYFDVYPEGFEDTVDPDDACE